MGKRRKARELALQCLYQLDVQNETDPNRALPEFWRRHPVDPEVRSFAEHLVRGTKLHQGKIDELIQQYALHWELERMAVVDSRSKVPHLPTPRRRTCPTTCCPRACTGRPDAPNESPRMGPSTIREGPVSIPMGPQQEVRQYALRSSAQILDQFPQR